MNEKRRGNENNFYLNGSLVEAADRERNVLRSVGDLRLLALLLLVVLCGCWCLTGSARRSGGFHRL